MRKGDLLYAIYSGYRNPWVYAGFFLKRTGILLYVQFNVDGGIAVVGAKSFVLDFLRLLKKHPFLVTNQS